MLKNFICFTEQVIEKRYERRPYKAKFGEIAEFIFINELIEPNFNAAWTSAVVFKQHVDGVVKELHLLRCSDFPTV